MLTVQNLRKMGYKVKVWHHRVYMCDNSGKNLTGDYAPRGGMTEIQVYDMSDQNVYTGTAYCSRKDQYDRKLGVKIALGRALKQMGI